MSSSVCSEDCVTASSDYGSDIDVDGDTQLSHLTQEIEALHSSQPELLLESIENHATSGSAIVPIASYSRQSGWSHSSENELWTVELDAESFRFDPAAIPQHRIERDDKQRGESAPSDLSIPDTRTPLERFRTTPKKPLSVTDLVSPAWCELQYWYTLTKFGKKKRTPAMKQGSVVHKTLEDQVHETIQVEVQTREDMWGLRIWNIIQGLRTLRATGLTREMEVWGVIEGQVVNGVIDELSHTCTNPQLEDRLKDGKSLKGAQRDPNQSSISQFFNASGSEGDRVARSMKASSKSSATSGQKIYLTDVKTRGSTTLPAGASLRPTTMQLMIYRKMLCDLANDTVDAEQIFERYRLDGSCALSDSLIAQLSGLDQRVESTGTSSDDADSVIELLTHNSLTQLWRLMIREFALTMPAGPTSVSRVLRAEFRNARSGTVIGSKTFVHDDAQLHAYLADEMGWWRGEREARGVDVEEAFKCRICEFADGCSWRETKVDEAVQRSRTRAQAQVEAQAQVAG